MFLENRLERADSSGLSTPIERLTKVCETYFRQMNG